MNFKKRVIPLLMSFVILGGTFSGSFSVSAAEATASSNNELLTNSITAIQDEDLIKTVKPYVVTENYKFKLINVDELKLKISENDFNLVKEQVAKRNKMFAEMKNDKHFKKTDNNSFQYTISNKETAEKLKRSGYKDMAATLSSSDPGYNKVDWHLFSVEIWMSHDTVQAIIIAGTAAAGVALARVFPGLTATMCSAAGMAVIGFYSDRLAAPYYVEFNFLQGITKAYPY